MSNFFQELDDDVEQFQGTIVSQSSNGSPNPTENDPDAEVVALSPRTLMATNRYICEVCHKGFQRDQNLQLHRRGHNLPWKLKQRPTTQIKKRVYVCPEPTCMHHDPSRALGDLTGIKKHFCRKHGEKKWKCDKCSKCYAVQSDWKAHTKICGTREYRCDCGTIFSRKDSFITHRAFCDALAEENYKANQNLAATGGILQSQVPELVTSTMPSSISCSKKNSIMNLTNPYENIDISLRPLSLNSDRLLMPSKLSPMLNPRASLACLNSPDESNVSPMAIGAPYTSATALLQKAAEMGTKISDNSISPILLRGFTGYSTSRMNSSGSAHEGSVIVSSNMGPTAASMNNLFVGETEFDENFNPGYPRNGYSISQTQFCESPLNMHPESRNNVNILRGEVYTEGGKKMTLDFLEVEPIEHSTIGKKRHYEGNIMELGYSNPHQNLHSSNSEWKQGYH
ncbi:nucleic acid binding protein, putative [Ricinus communis]|uniref:Nucleic acid binding protein, putative n=2 Tax=Ricinus communis TaxID=3988 RepID=B9RG23_RICCO|nr:nucleic acid binding protein, putative [Ricinus communis]